MGAIRVLIIEDDKDIVDLVRSVLEPSFECFTAANGMEGLQQAVRGEPDLVICDIMMPVMDGWEFMRKLRAMRGYDHMPVVFLSAISSRSQIQQSYELGIALYVTKPIDPMRFKRLIELFIKDHSIEPRTKRLSIERVRALGVFPEIQAGPTPSGRSPSAAPPPAVPRPPLSRIDVPEPAVPTDVRARVMVVDDDEDICGMIHAALKDEFELIEAHDGITAIDFAVRYKPDIFIVDGMLPRMTGYQLTVMLKKNRDFYRSPIIFISGKATARDRDYVSRLGVMDFLAKPFTPDQIRRLALTVARRPDFTIRTDRPRADQVQLEQLHRVETQRGQGPRFHVEQIERPPMDHI